MGVVVVASPDPKYPDAPILNKELIEKIKNMEPTNIYFLNGIYFDENGLDSLDVLIENYCNDFVKSIKFTDNLLWGSFACPSKNIEEVFTAPYYLVEII